MGGKSGVSQEIISVPKGGPSLRGIGETFLPNLFTGTANFSVPIVTSPGRGGFGPELTLRYSSGNGNSPFGLGWALSIPQVSLKTEKGIPKYTDADIFLLSDSEDLVERADSPPRNEGNFRVTTYRPRIEGLFARIEKWELKSGSPSNPCLNNIFWKVTTKKNLTSIYGGTSQAILANPDDSRQIFQWLVELTYDANGNYILYEYKKEEGTGIPDEIYERNHRHTQIYLKRIRYGNLLHFDPFNSSAIEKLLTNQLADQEHFFLVVFDYGEHGAVEGGHELITSNMHHEEKPWDIRPDPFSSFRVGFEIRTYRRCKRVLMFHNGIPGEAGPVLVKSTDFYYKQNKDSSISMLIGVTRRGYKKSSSIGNFSSEEIALGELGVRSTIYDIKSIPRLDFWYTEFRPKEQRYVPFEARDGDLPVKGLNNPDFALVDLFGAGLPDILQTTPTGYYYWRNLGHGLFDRRNVLNNMPTGVTLSQDGVGFGDMAGDGQADLLVHAGNMWGFYEATNKGGWKDFHPYRSYPSFSLTDHNVRLIDLTGDGKSDVLRTDHEHFTYFPCLGEEGFGEPEVVERIHDLDKFPDVYFNDLGRRVFLADMTGDGLQDIVMVHSGCIDYWPNLGYGRFGKRITMKNAPNFGYNFDPRRLFLVDVDGSGLADLVYVESEKVRFWFNQSGNSWSDENVINGTPVVTDVTNVQMADMFGNGSQGILWSSDYRGPHQSNYLFLDLTGRVKPYVLTEISNNMGVTIRAKYVPSTYFYLEDLGKSEQWATTAPFPVQVLEKVEVIDHISKSKLVTQYTYHHGYYDGREREFRGFGRVEQLDTEIFGDCKESGLHEDGLAFKKDKNTHVPPILTKSWFHTGVYEEEKKILEIFRSEYYKGDGQEFSAHSVMKGGGDSPFEAYRALKGAILRTEVYALDEKPESENPYTVSENGYEVRQIQVKGKSHSGVFFTTGLETFNFYYERKPADPRVSQKITHEVDDYGNILRSLDITYPRRNPAYPEQSQFFIVLNENKYVNQDDPTGPYFIGLNYESKKKELLNVTRLPNIPVRHEDVTSLNIDAASHNLFSHTRSYYDGREYQGLQLGKVGSRGLLTRTEILAFKNEQFKDVYGNRVQSSDLFGEGYEELPNEPGNLWMQKIRTKYGNASQFFLPIAQKDPMGNETSTQYDDFKLLPIKTIAPLNTVIEAKNDYRKLAPYLTIDPNLNHVWVEFDALGMVIATSLMGKVSRNDQIEGDPIDHPTTHLEYCFFNFWKTFRVDPTKPEPNFVRIFKREEHYAVDPNARIQESYSYFDGFGREVQTKIQAEPDSVTGNPRWVGSGWKVYNNKGWAVESFEPFFSDTHEYEGEKKMGVSARTTFDPLGRTIRIDSPDGTFTKVEFSTWHQTTWDSNDTVTDLRDVAGTFANKWYEQKSRGTFQEQDAAAKALAHKDTPLIVHLDALGRDFLSIEDNGTYGKYETRNEFDVQGNVIKIIDPRGNKALECKYDLLKNPLYRWQMDSGEKYILLNATGNPVKKWDSRNHLVETRYDALNRPIEVWVTELTSNTKRLAEKIVYGESESNPESRNLKGQMYQQYDGAGLATYDKYDFKGNLLKSSRLVLKDYKTAVDWGEVPAPAFISDVPYEYSADFDALNRIKEFISPDKSRYIPTYNEANLLEKVDCCIRGRTPPNSFVLNINYNAKGQREKIEYANGATTKYNYDPCTFRLASLLTYKKGKLFQKYQYTYDAAGNITSLEDGASQTVYFRSAVVRPDREYLYDPLYRLIEAKGREHAGHVAKFDHEDFPYISGIPHQNDANALSRYTETYRFDESGNIREIRHRANGDNWVRKGQYRALNNQLEKTVGGRPSQPTFTYHHDPHGNHINFTHIQSIDWDYKDRMVKVDKGGEKIYYLYDYSGQRIRKVTENSNGIPKRERLYLGGYEIYLEFSNRTVEMQRETLHVMDDKQRIALVETVVRDNHTDISNPTPRLRYQCAEHLGSSVLELDEVGEVISFEEYFPYGGTSYHSTSRNSQVSQKRYRYNGKEMDEETGFYYYGARYYVPWIGRWVSIDPRSGFSGSNLYAFNRSNPINRIDNEGLQDELATGENNLGDPNIISEAFTYETSESSIGVGIIIISHPANIKIDFSTPKEIPQAPESEGSGFIQGLQRSWEKGSTADKVEMVATGIGAVGGLIPYAGDYASLGASVVCFAAKPSWSSAGEMLLDLIGALLPFVPAMGTIRRTHRISDLGNAAHEAEKVADAVHHTENFADAVHDTENLADALSSERRFWTKTTEFRGNKVYQRDDLINPKRVDATGKTNLQRMQDGLAPIGPDGEPIALHHMLQTADGPIAEVTGTFHRKNKRVVHINPPTIPSGIDRNAFDAWKRQYWINRASSL